LSLLAVLAAGGASMIGVLRAALAPAMILAVLGIGWEPLCEYLARPLARGRSARTVSFAMCLVTATAFIASEHWIPTSEIRRYTNAIVYREQSDREVFVVTSGQDAFELHVDGRLKLSGVDEGRYFEALVQPALA